jgi:membrane fusion protein (multidrug efflux system)
MLILLLIPLCLSERIAVGQKPQEEAQKVAITTVQSKAVTITQQYVCKIQSLRHIEVRAPAEGYIVAISIKEGQSVKSGEMLFEIGPILHKARLDAKQAEREIAQLELNNTKKLAERQGVSPLEVKLFEAKLAKAQAETALASAELDFTRVKAPFDGLAGRVLRQRGSFVLKGETLTTLSDNSVMRVYFNMPEKRYLEYMAGVRENQQSPDLELILADQSKFPHAGKLDAVGADFNTNTGDITFRADFPNPSGLLRHGQTGRLLINGVLEDAILVPQRATFENLDKRYVFVVDKDHVAHQREIVVQHETEDFFVVKKGVGAGDRIVLEGVRVVRDGDKVE